MCGYFMNVVFHVVDVVFNLIMNVRRNRPDYELEFIKSNDKRLSSKGV